MTVISKIPDDCISTTIASFLEVDEWLSMSGTCKSLHSQRGEGVREIAKRSPVFMLPIIREIFGEISRFYALPKMNLVDFTERNKLAINTQMTKQRISLARGEKKDAVFIFLRMKNWTPHPNFSSDQRKPRFEAWCFEKQEDGTLLGRCFSFESLSSGWFRNSATTAINGPLFENYSDYLKRLIQNENCGLVTPFRGEGPRTTVVSGRNVSTISLLVERKDTTARTAVFLSVAVIALSYLVNYYVSRE